MLLWPHAEATKNDFGFIFIALDPRLPGSIHFGMALSPSCPSMPNRGYSLEHRNLNGTHILCLKSHIHKIRPSFISDQSRICQEKPREVLQSVSVRFE
jgi:hypothetical protein